MVHGTRRRTAVECSISTKRPHAPAVTADTDRVLRAKYFDWCSARIADHFVNLTTPEIYALADAAPHAASADASFQAVMERATETLAARMDLPSFEDWLEGYEKDPAGYEADLIGFWREL